MGLRRFDMAVKSHEIWIGDNLVVNMSEDGTIEDAQAFCPALNDWLDAKERLESSDAWISDLEARLQERMNLKSEEIGFWKQSEER